MATATTNTSSSSTKSKSIGKAAEVTPAVHKSAADRVSTEGGKRMYKMADGKSVELPADMTAEEAAKLEADGNAAKKQLGKGPAPKPVPNVKEKAKGKEKKAEKKAAPAKKKKPEIKGGKGKAHNVDGKGGKGAIKGKVGAWLLAKGAPSIARGQSKLAVLKTNEQKHDDAASKLSQTQKAVVPPALEGQSKSNSSQVKSVDDKPAPPVNEAQAKQALDQAIEANIPQNIEDVDNFKRDNKAGHMSAAAGLVVNTDKNAVSGTFGDMKQTPAPTPSDVKPEALPPEEIAPVTAKMNLGTDTIAPLQKEHTDVSNYTKEADSKLQEEGVTQEQLDMVDSGDLAEANKEKKGMAKKASTEPLAVQQFAQQQNKEVDKDLQQEETKGKDEIKNQRKKQLGSTKDKQNATKTGIEKKREEVTAKINQIYTDAQTKVTKKLADLETVAIKRFDDGNAEATKEFEGNVKSELDAFKDERYSGFWGWAKKAKDWLLGMDDLPQVKAIFDRNRAIFVKKVNTLVETISADNKKVVQECKDELANARKTIEEYVSKLGPELQDVGKKAQEEMNGKLDELDQFVAKKEKELQDKLADKQKAAIKAIDEKIEKMKEEMSGALSKLGKLLLLAAKKFFTWALEKFGFSLAEIEGIINKGAAVLKAIFTQPIQFVKNLMNAALTGFKNFGKNFLKHLQNALFEWLTGSLEGLVLPKTWDFKGIVGIALQMIGISYQNIRRHMVTEMGEPVVAGLEKTFTLVVTLVTEGPMAAWEQLKEMAGEMKEAFIEAVKDFIKTKIIEQAIQWLVSLFVPGAGIIKAIVGIYDTVVFFIQKAKTIMQMVGNFLGSIAEIASGNIGAAADAMENGLARGLSLVINFLAALLRLNGITDKIKNAIQKIRDKVDGVLSKVAKWIATKAKKLLAPVTAKIDQAKEWGQKKVDQAKEKVTDKIEQKQRESANKNLSPEEKKQKIDSGIRFLHAEEGKYLDSDRISKEDAANVARATKQNHTVFTSFKVVDKGDSWSYVYTASPEEEVPGKKKLPSSEELLELSKAHFVGDKIKFRSGDLIAFIMSKGVSKPTAERRLADWKKSPAQIFEYSSAANDKLKEMSFDATALEQGERPTSPGNRAKYGYGNPDQESATGLIIIKKGFEAKNQLPGYKSGDENDLNFLKTKAIFKSARSGKLFKWFDGDKNLMVLGHKHDAASHWNHGGGEEPHAKPGHTQMKEENSIWNRNHKNYQGPEEKYESAASGAEAGVYEKPSKDRVPPSHPMWWDIKHTNYVP